MKHILTEAYATTRKLTGIDPSKPGNIRQVLFNDDAFNTYVDGLSESIESTNDKEGFRTLCENTRINLLENSMFQINPYESLALPVLRVFYPKLVAKEAVTVSPMDKPESVKPFLKASFEKYPFGTTDKYNAPSISEDISNGPQIDHTIAGALAVPQEAFDLLNLAGLDPSKAHLERDFEITLVDDGTTPTAVSIVPAVEGHFSAAVEMGGVTDVISGYIDYLNGTISISSATGAVTSIEYKVTTSLEENKINPKVKLEVDKIRLYAKDREISANWSIHMEQDMKALFDISMQAEIVSVLGQQIALDIDREIISALLNANLTLNAANHRSSFSRVPPGSFTWGQKAWHENILVKMNELSAQVYTDTNIDQANTVLCNPIDAAILEDINTFRYAGTSSENGELGFREATVNGGKWKVLTSSVVAAGEMLMVYKPVEEIKCVYLYCPYVPVVLSPYPLGATPSLTILSRNANALVRSAGIASLQIT